MFRLIIFTSVIVLGVVCNSLDAAAETWSDTTGKFSIEAQFQGVEGKSVVLLKSNGKKVTVPIARLSPESRAQAKSMYEAMIREADSAMSSDASSAPDTNAPTHATRSLNFQPPTPPAMAAMPTFPDGMTMEQTLNFIEQQVFDGHPEVFWYAMPKEMRDTFDDPRLRKAVNPFVTEQQPMIEEAESLVFKGIEVLVTKKEFVLGSAQVVNMPPMIQPLIARGYDPAVGVAYELADLGFSLDPENRSISEMVDYHLPRIGAHLKSLLAMIPPELRATLRKDVSVEQIDSDHAVVHLPVNQQPQTPGDNPLTVNPVPEEVRMVRVAQRWVPEGLVDAWNDLKVKLESGSIDETVEQVQSDNADQTQGATMMMGMFKGMMEAKLDLMLAAKTQTQFDTVLAQEASPPDANFGELE